MLSNRVMKDRQYFLSCMQSLKNNLLRFFFFQFFFSFSVSSLDLPRRPREYIENSRKKRSKTTKTKRQRFVFFDNQNSRNLCSTKCFRKKGNQPLFQRHLQRYFSGEGLLRVVKDRLIVYEGGIGNESEGDVFRVFHYCLSINFLLSQFPITYEAGFFLLG